MSPAPLWVDPTTIAEITKYVKINFLITEFIDFDDPTAPPRRERGERRRRMREINGYGQLPSHACAGGDQERRRDRRAADETEYNYGEEKKLVRDRPSATIALSVRGLGCE